MQVEVAEFILNTKPSSVVVETAVNEAHGSRTGQVLTIDDLPPDDITNVFQQFGRMLACERFPVRSHVWQVCTSMLLIAVSRLEDMLLRHCLAGSAVSLPSIMSILDLCKVSSAAKLYDTESL